MELTSEQADICADPLDRGGLVVVNAYAGSGKSTTLRLLAETHPRQKFLYLCFNKTVADAARQVFPSNVRVSTMHGVAYAAMRKRFASSKLGRELRPGRDQGSFSSGKQFQRGSGQGNIAAVPLVHRQGAREPVFEREEANPEDRGQA